MSACGDTVIFLVGRTGDGKSTLGNEIVKCLGNDSRPFLEGSSPVSITHTPKVFKQGNIQVVDNPGLMDTAGVFQDEKNIQTIVAKANELGHVNLIVLVINSGACKFDEGMQVTLKAILDSFDKQSLDNLVIAYTNCVIKNISKLEQKTREICEITNNRCGTNVKSLRFFAVENHPEELSEYVPEEKVTKLYDETKATVNELIDMAKSKRKYYTLNSIAAQTEKARALEQAQRDQAAAAAAASAAYWESYYRQQAQEREKAARRQQEEEERRVQREREIREKRERELREEEEEEARREEERRIWRMKQEEERRREERARAEEEWWRRNRNSSPLTKLIHSVLTTVI